MNGSGSLRFRGVERIIIVLIAGFFGYLGYRLFERGTRMDPASLEVTGFFGRWVLSGTAPGVFVMVLACVVLVVALRSRVSESVRRERTGGIDSHMDSAHTHTSARQDHAIEVTETSSRVSTAGGKVTPPDSSD